MYAVTYGFSLMGKQHLFTTCLRNPSRKSSEREKYSIHFNERALEYINHIKYTKQTALVQSRKYNSIFFAYFFQNHTLVPLQCSNRTHVDITKRTFNMRPYNFVEKKLIVAS